MLRSLSSCSHRRASSRAASDARWYDSCVSIRVLIYEPGQPPVERMIEPDLDTLRGIVGGDLGGIKIAPELLVYFDDDGRLRGKPTCAFLSTLGDTLVGTCIVVGVGDDGKERSLTDEEIAHVKSVVTPVGFLVAGRGTA